MNWQDDVARDDKTHGSPEEGVAGKMIAGGNSKLAISAPFSSFE
jgi:hypothetical protein